MAQKKNSNSILRTSGEVVARRSANRLQEAADARGHGNATKGAGVGGLLGGMLGSFAGPGGALVGGAVGAGLGSLLASLGD